MGLNKYDLCFAVAYKGHETVGSYKGAKVYYQVIADLSYHLSLRVEVDHSLASYVLIRQKDIKIFLHTQTDICLLAVPLVISCELRILTHKEAIIVAESYGTLF